MELSRVSAESTSNGGRSFDDVEVALFLSDIEALGHLYEEMGLEVSLVSTSGVLEVSTTDPYESSISNSRLIAAGEDTIAISSESLSLDELQEWSENLRPVSAAEWTEAGGNIEEE